MKSTNTTSESFILKEVKLNTLFKIKILSKFFNVDNHHSVLDWFFLHIFNSFSCFCSYTVVVKKTFILSSGYWIKPRLHPQWVAADPLHVATQHQVARHTVVVHHSTTVGFGACPHLHTVGGGGRQINLHTESASPAGCLRRSCQQRKPHPAASHLKGEPQLCVDQWQLGGEEMWNSFGLQERSACRDWGNMWECVQGRRQHNEKYNRVECASFSCCTQDWMKAPPHHTVDLCHLFLIMSLPNNICLFVFQDQHDFHSQYCLLPSRAVDKTVIMY